MKLLINFLKMWAKPPIVTAIIIIEFLLLPFTLFGILVDEILDQTHEFIKRNF